MVDYYSALLWPACCVLAKFICWSPNPQCDRIRRWGLQEVFGFRWSHEDGAPMMQLVPFWEDTRALAHSATWGPREKVASTSQDVGSHQTPELLAPWPRTCRPPELWGINVPCLSHPVCGILWQHPELRWALKRKEIPAPATTQMHLEDTMLSKINQSPKDRYYVIHW